MKSPVRVRRAPGGNKVFGHTSSQVQYYAMALAGVWVGIPEKYHQAVMNTLGLTQDQFMFYTVLAIGFLTLAGKATSIERVDRAPPQEGPDHVL